MTLRAAAYGWEIDPGRDFFGHLHDVVREAVDRGVELLVLPELFSLELLGRGPVLESEAPTMLAPYFEEIANHLLSHAREYGLTIVGGSHFKTVLEGFANVCPVATPTGRVWLQPKNNLTAYEHSVWDLVTPEGLNPVPPLGALVCYDSEFPEAGRELSESGVTVLAVPAFTEGPHGFTRVRMSCLARAIENQIFVIHASLGGCLDCEPVPTTTGSCALIAPPVPPFPSSGILCEGFPWAIADLNFTVINHLRMHGEVRNWQDRRRSTWRLRGNAISDSAGEAHDAVRGIDSVNQ